MEGYSFRPASYDDISIVHQLVIKQNILDFGDSLRSLEDIQKTWDSPGFDLKADTQVAVTPNGEIAGYAELSGRGDLLIYLSSEHQDSKVSGHLLKLLEARAKSQKSGREPLALYGRAGFRNPTLIQTFDSNGFASNISFLIMEINMTEAPILPSWPANIKVRPFAVNKDEQAVYQTDEEAAQDKGYHDPLSFEQWTIRMSMDKESFDPNIWFLACENENVIGVALNAYQNGSQAAWVDHLSIRRAWRNKGVGKALLLHTFGEFFKRGIQTIRLSVDSKSLTNAPRLYESVGMQTIQKYHVYKKVI